MTADGWRMRWIAAPLAMAIISAGSPARANPSPADDWAATEASAEAAFCGPLRTSMDAPAAHAMALAETMAADDPRRITALTWAGHADQFAGNDIAARAHFDAAVALLDHIGRRGTALAVRPLTELAEVSINLGFYQQPVEIAMEAVRVADGDPATSLVDRVYAHRVAAFALGEVGRFDEARRMVAAGLAVAQTQLGAGHCATLELRGVEAIIALREGRVADADRLSTSIVADAERRLGPTHFITRSLLDNHATFVDERGDHTTAEQMVRQVLGRTPPDEDPAHPTTLYAANRLTSLLLEQRRFAEAEKNASAVLAKAEVRLPEGHPALADALQMMGEVDGAMGRNGDALALLRRVRALREAIGGPGSLPVLFVGPKLATQMVANGDLAGAEQLLRGDLADAIRLYGADSQQVSAERQSLAGLLASADRHADAIALFEATLPSTIARFGDDSPAVRAIQFNIAFSRWGLGQRDAAEPELARLFQLAQDRDGETHPDTIRIAGALAALRLQMPERQLAAMQPALLYTHAMTRYRHDAADSINAAELTMLADAIWVRRSVDAGKTRIGDAFTALQEAMAGGPDRAVLHTAARRVADGISTELGTLVRQREKGEAAAIDVQRQLDAMRATTNADQTVLAGLRDQGSAIATRIANIDTQLAEGFPDYFSLIIPQAMTQARVQNMLRPDEAVVLIVPSDYGTHIIALTHGDGTWVRAEINRTDVDAYVRRLQFDLGAPVTVSNSEAARWQAEGGRGYPFARSVAYALYTHLFPAAIQRVIGNRQHVFIATTGSLASLPLGVLVTDRPEGADGDAAALRATHWLADRYALITIPTLQSLWLQRRAASVGGPSANTTNTQPLAPSAFAANTASPPTFIGFGDPLLDGVADARGGGRGARRSGGDLAAAYGASRAPSALADPMMLKHLARLPGTATELQNMRRALGAPETSLYLGAAATERALRSTDFSNARIIALATHGLMAGELNSGLQPGLVFTPPDHASADDDGLLTPPEIAGLHLNAEWVILSACNTAAGDSGDARGLTGLAQAFFFAGAQTLLASYWPVRDDVAARITVRIIELQRANPAWSRAQAVQAATREIRNDASHDSVTDSWAHPNAWAPFAIIGDAAH